MQEIFIPIDGFEDYFISNLGNVKSKKNGKEIILKQHLSKKGYLSVGLFKVKRNTKRIHQLVAIAFHNHVPDGHNVIVDHIDNDKLNNNANNLQLISVRENTSKDQFRRNHTSKYVGVSWYKTLNKWRAIIRINGKVKHLGIFKNELDAAKAYQDKLKEITSK